MTRVSKTIRHFPATILTHRSKSIPAATLVLLDVVMVVADGAHRKFWFWFLSAGVLIVGVLVFRLAAMSDGEESE